jgi:phosphatidate cytidylyltransferase
MAPPRPPLSDPVTPPSLVGLDGALSDPGVRLILGVVVGVLVVAGAVIAALSLAGRLKPELKKELISRTLAWGVMAPLVTLPVLFGRGPTTLLFTLLGLLCYREFARATGLFRDKVLSALVVAAIVLFNFAALDHWPGLWQALAPLSIVALAAAAVLRDDPRGYIQRVGLSAMAVLLFGACLSHLSFFTCEPTYRAPLMLLLLAIGLNDVFAFCVGKTLGGPKLAPRTSPGKTVSGAVGAVVLTTLTAWALGSRVFHTDLSDPRHLLAMGALASVAGILGDLTISSVKRDVGVKDMGALIPGHGGVLDRCNSLLLAAPALFHYVAYMQGVGLLTPTRLITGDLLRANGLP